MTSKEPPRAVRDQPDRSHLIFNWRVPGRAGGKPFAITGFLGYVRATGEPGRDWVIPAAAAALGSCALAVLGVGARARRARRRAP